MRGGSTCILFFYICLVVGVCSVLFFSFLFFFLFFLAGWMDGWMKGGEAGLGGGGTDVI